MLVGVVLAVVLGVLAMHQLMAPAPMDHSMASIATAGQHRGDDHTAATVGAAPVTAPDAASQHDRGAADCMTCGDHPILMALCVLALSLLVLTWRLPGPWSRLAPPVARRPLPSPPAVFRRLRPLSLAELSVCRT